MSLSVAAIDALTAAGATPEMVLAAVRAELVDVEQKAAAKRQKNAERMRSVRAQSARVHDVQRTGAHKPAGTPVVEPASADQSTNSVETDGAGEEKSVLAFEKEIPPTPPKEKLSLPTSPTPESSRGKSSKRVSARAKPGPGPDWPADYRDQFWREFPNKVGKARALPKLDGIAKSGTTTFADLMAGLRRYTAKTDDRYWLNPATWLHQERWNDEPAPSLNFRNRTNGNGTQHRGFGSGAGGEGGFRGGYASYALHLVDSEPSS